MYIYVSYGFLVTVGVMNVNVATTDEKTLHIIWQFSIYNIEKYYIKHIINTLEHHFLEIHYD